MSRALRQQPRLRPDLLRRSDMENRMCSVKGCEKPPRSRTAEWCPMHYHRWYRHGDPEVSLLGHGFVDFHGYRVVSAPGHPLARKRGDVLEHRRVLFDAIGAGEHPCHWCGTEVSWSESYPSSIRGLVVDHLDGDRLNNDLSNLVPSCAPCNGGRCNSRKRDR